jgi:DNA-binding LacI/PurR family transcriptional regulator
VSTSAGQVPPVPLYYQVRVAIQKEILEGRLRPGDMLPSEQVLCAQYKVSSITMRRALRDLVQSGHIYRENGVGTFVAQPTRRFSIALLFCGFAEEGWRRQSHMFGALIGSVGQVIWEHGSALTVSNVASMEVLANVIRQVAENTTFDGLLIRADQEPPASVADLLASLSVPYVFIKKKPLDRAANAVWMDHRQHARLATEHLLELGHHRIGLLLARPESLSAQERAQGYRDALAAAGLPLDEELVRHGSSEFADSGYAQTLALLDITVRPTALMIGVGEFIQGVYLALRDRNLKIPADIALVSFDEAGLATSFQPPLTTLSATDYDLGHESAKLLMGLLNGELSTPVERILEPSLVVRGTSAPPLELVGAPVSDHTAT